MNNINNCEKEIDSIRDKIYAETYYMSREEQALRLKEKTQILAEQYGFRIVKSTKEAGTVQ